MTSDSQQAVLAVQKAQKMAKKLKKLQARLAGSTVSDEDQAALDKLQKKLKKLRQQCKDAKQAADTAVDTAPSTESEDSAVPVPAAHSEEAAGKKKSKKRDREAAAAAASEAAAPQKKPKKQAAAAGKKQLAVGDAQLAATRPPLVRALYNEHPAVAGMSEQQVQEVHEQRRTAVEGCDLRPVLSFEQTGLPANMLHATRDFVTPSPIQSQCWPIILSGHDMIGIAATGSGKTLAFGLPMLRHIAAQREGGVVTGKGPVALVMAPTRELALQIAAVLEDAGSKCGIGSVCVYGGVPKHPQVSALRSGVDIVVGTPGRLEDLMQDGACKLHNVTYLVLDEADRMLDLGFEPHIRAISSQVRSDRQTLMFSATWPTAVQQLAQNYLSEPVKVTIGSQDLAASHSVTQLVEVVEQHQRDDRLLALLGKYHSSRSNRIIIFVLYKKEAPRVEALLSRKGWKAAAIHGDISQTQRTAAVEAFKAGTCPLLIATDVAARGLDIPDVEVVINYSFPLTIEDYVHRIGRTGRAGKTGTAVTFFVGNNDKQRAGELINVLREAKQKVPESLLSFGTTVKKKEHKLYGAHFNPNLDLSKKASKITFDD
ncbi:P-loop containing nucleoside triphosphate hydrolase protein [Scenedesmus sp. NREL 46B-D3]|nr:P-loop containing nucleoside triphosphate hydrolase protein [Scenedesmus sp. NREL 46B-D3]